MQLFDLYSPWIPWIEAALLGVVLLIGVLQPRSILISMQALTSPIQRRYTPGSGGVVVYVLRGVYQLGTISLAMLMGVNAFMGNGNMPTMLHYGEVILVVAAVMLGKVLLDKWILFTFHSPVHEATYYAYRNELWQVLCLVCWGCMVLSEWWGSTFLWIGLGVAVGGYVLLVGWKLMQVIGWSVAHVWYLMIYIIHAEMIPLAFMAGGTIYVLR